jgi:hypothetical protein
MARFGADIALPDLRHANVEQTSRSHAVHGLGVENRRGPMMADDPNGRMKGRG